MQLRIWRLILLTVASLGSASALEPNEILVIANRDIPASERLARYYCRKRRVPQDNILLLPLRADLNEQISREGYEKQLAEPIRERLFLHSGAAEIKCLLTTYGVPIKAGRRGPLPGMEKRLKTLKELAAQEKKTIEERQQKGRSGSAEHKKHVLKSNQIKQEIDRITGVETNASVDSELSMLLFGNYDLYRWRLNAFRDQRADSPFRVLMVSRLDGPDDIIAKALVDKALAAEQKGLKGTAYVDSRGIFKRNVVGRYDQSLRDLAILTRLRTELPVKEEATEALFAPGSCPGAALYCGWYSLKKYVDAFGFVDGAVGYHISSFGADNLRHPNSTHWCPAMLAHGITATLGAVAEPYLHAFPEPKAFFAELFAGNCIAEAYYRTKPFNSWQLVLIGDPLYTPFKKP